MSYSIIIPTMWFANTTLELIQRLIDCEYVHQIIVINNKKDNTPNSNLLDNSKLTILNQDKNLYVNPSWNLGVKYSTEKNICILNDDVLFDPNKIFSKVDANLLENIGILATDPISPETEEIELIKMQTWSDVPWGSGCLMCLNKDKYIQIPESVKIFYGDTFLFKILWKYGVYYNKGLMTNQKHGTTWRNSCNDEFINDVNKTIQMDHYNWPDVLTNYKL